MEAGPCKGRATRWEEPPGVLLLGGELCPIRNSHLGLGECKKFLICLRHYIVWGLFVIAVNVTLTNIKAENP